MKKKKTSKAITVLKSLFYLKPQATNSDDYCDDYYGGLDVSHAGFHDDPVELRGDLAELRGD